MDTSDGLNLLESHIQDVLAAARDLSDRCRELPPGSPAGSPSTPNASIVPSNAPLELHRLRRSILAKVARLHTLLYEPADFIQHLASQNQLLACLYWLGELQVLACIPLSGSVLARDVADVAGVPEMQLSRVVRLTATAGFLREPRPGYIEHTPLSAPFVTKLSYFDAAMFIAETAAPAAMQMAAATRHQEQSTNGATRSPFMLTSDTLQTFQTAHDQRPKLQRQWSAYLMCTGDCEDGVTEILRRLDWPSLGTACVVDVDALDTTGVLDLAELFPALNFVVQTSEPGALSNGNANANAAELEVIRLRQSLLSSRIAVQKRIPGTPQTVKDGAVYILRLRSPFPNMSFHSLRERIAAELQAHLGVLRANPSATFILAPRLLPDPNTTDPDVEAVARLRDLTLLQLANERLMEAEQLVEIVHSVGDGAGRLAVVSKLGTRNSATTALGIKYQANTEEVPAARPTLL